MEKRKIDKQQDLIMNLLRPLVYLWMRIDAKRKVIRGEGVSFRRKEPFIMLANHTFMFDVIHVPLRFKNVPFIVANQTLFKKPSTKFLVTQVAHVIAKQKGQSDTATVRDLIGAVKRGYPILIFPEGDTTFYGETNYIEESTMKLIKKLEIDVITCNVRGGYLSKPRWAISKRKKRYAEFYYELTIPKEEIKNLSVDEINEKIKKALYHNAYDYQRVHRIAHPGKRLAEGLENVVYVCPECEAIHSIQTEKNRIWCTSCHTEGLMDKFGFIQGFKYDNLIEWNQFQRQYQTELKKSIVSSKAMLYYLNEENQELTPVGDVLLTYKDYHLNFEGALNESIPIDQIINPTITFRRDLGFIYQDRSFLIILEKSTAGFLRILQNKY